MLFYFALVDEMHSSLICFNDCKGDFSSRALAAHLATSEKDFDDKTPKGASWRDIEFSYNDSSLRLPPYEGKRSLRTDAIADDDEADSLPARSPKREQKSRYVREAEESDEERPVARRGGARSAASPRADSEEDEDEVAAAAARPRRDRF